jgi:hypothetical protein
MSDASRIAELKHQHLKTVNEQENKFAGEENELRQRLDATRKDAVESVGLSGQQSLKHAGQRRDVAPSHDEHIANRVDKIGSLKAKHEEQRKKLDGEHKKQMEAAMARPTPSVDTSEPKPGDPLHGFWMSMTYGERRSWHEISEKYTNRRDALDQKQAEARGKNSRYPSAAGPNHERDVNEHLKLRQAEEKEKRSLRAGVESRLSTEQRARDQRGAA